jgi:hypothetical protein
MSLTFTDKLVLWLHIAFVMFTIGPVTVAIMTTPRYIRARNLVVVRYIYRTTRIFALLALGVLVFGIILGQQLHELAKPWLTASMTLFVVALVLLVIIIRDQRKAITGLEVAAAADAPATAAAPATAVTAAAPGTAAAGAATVTDSSPEAVDDAHAAGQPDPVQPATARQVATVERGRITTTGAVVSVIWLVILILMVWR